MLHKIIDINVDYEAMGVKPSPRQTTLTEYILNQENIDICIWKKRPAIIVCPGGGYGGTSCREAEPIALHYLSAGFQCFVLDYSVRPSSWPAAAVELSKSIIYVREHAEEYNIDANQIYVCGFSAGGHLAASVGVHYNHPDIIRFSGAVNENNKPDGIILGYPVITGEISESHAYTINNFVGENENVRPLASLENYVNENTPEMFIFHTFSDTSVPVTSSIRLATALNANKVKFEMHIYPDGCHGLSLANKITATGDHCLVTPVQSWIKESIRWVDDRQNKLK